MKETRYDDWDVSRTLILVYPNVQLLTSPQITYRGNRFAWLGNGYSQTELDPTCDLGYYIRFEDDSP
jgi:hypothetical protein